MSMDEKHYGRALFERLLHSDLFATYQDAFRCATGLPLRLVGSDLDQWCLDDQSGNRSPFCEKLNLCKSACASCVDTNRRLMSEAAVNGPTTCHCFAGMAASAVPVYAGSGIIAFLKTGQVFHQVPDPSAYDAVSKTLSRQGLQTSEIESLRDAYLQTRSVEPERYQSMVTLLATFARQLGKHAETLVIVSEGGEPAAIARAKDYIRDNLTEPLPLALVARKAGLSESHFCRVFRTATGLTLTDYVNRKRIEWAKQELLKSGARVSEIAFLIGYQSLSQFNRSFARLTGKSPSAWRAEELARLGAA